MFLSWIVEMFSLQATSKISTSQTNRLKSRTKGDGMGRQKKRQECEGGSKRWRNNVRFWGVGDAGLTIKPRHLKIQQKPVDGFFVTSYTATTWISQAWSCSRWPTVRQKKRFVRWIFDKSLQNCEKAQILFRSV